eukprot:1515479-Pyramimonas_sp.AAC.1
MAHKQCTRKLERVKKQISTAKHDLQPLQQKCDKVQEELAEKNGFLESKQAEEQVPAKQLAEHAAQLSGTAENDVEVPPPDILHIGPESDQFKDDPDLLLFYKSAADRTWRQNMAS